MVLIGDDPKQIIHHVDQEEKDIKRKPDGNYDGQTGQKNTLQFLLQNSFPSPSFIAHLKQAR
jgi:hypothetical protein